MEIAPGLIISIWLNLDAVKLLYYSYSRAAVRSSFVSLEKSYPKRDVVSSSMNQGYGSQSAVIWQQALALVVLDKTPIAHGSLIVVILLFLGNCAGVSCL